MYTIATLDPAGSPIMPVHRGSSCPKPVPRGSGYTTNPDVETGKNSTSVATYAF